MYKKIEVYVDCEIEDTVPVICFKRDTIAQDWVAVKYQSSERELFSIKYNDLVRLVKQLDGSFDKC